MDKLEILRTKLTFWEKLNQAERDLIVRGSAFASYSKGETVYSAARDCVGVLVILSGELRAFMISDEGREATLYRLNSGEICILSASCILKSITFDVHIEAQSDTEVLLIDSASFSQITGRNVYAEVFSLQLAANRFSDVMWTMEQILFLRFDARLANFLLDESLRSGGAPISVTHDEIARHLGSAREVVTRMLQFFSKEGVVELRRGSVTILDREKLQQFSQQQFKPRKRTVV